MNEGPPIPNFDRERFERSVQEAQAEAARTRERQRLLESQSVPAEPTPSPLPRSVGDRPGMVAQGTGILDGARVGARSIEHDFSPTPIPIDSITPDGLREQWVYDAKYDVPTQFPLIEWGREWYGNGITPRGKNWFGETNLARPQFYLFGDTRTAVIAGRNAAGRTDNWASQANLFADLRVTDAGRFQAFLQPITDGGQNTRFELIDGRVESRYEFNANPITAFYEGDLGAILGGLHGTSPPFELPITAGIIPLFFQNGIWLQDGLSGVAMALPARHSRLLNWSNFDATFFATFDRLNSPAFYDEDDIQTFGTAWFIDAYGGYIETGYAYLNDRQRPEQSYHNMAASFTRRYFDRVSNSVRVIVNTGQDLPKEDRCADGVLLLVENSLITPRPLRFVPYANFFVGWDRPQSVSRAGVAGGILRNTGINFETDALGGYVTLDDTGSDTAGGALGVDLIGDDLDRQLLIEVAYQTPHGNANPGLPDDQFAVGTRYQIALTRATILRMDAMYGWRRGLEDVYGTRIEYRWKF
ncbi:MAG: hypothetical protein AAGA03_14650 [Planctomycetota bacterium]